MNAPVIWLNGEWKTKETAAVSLYDHGLLYGDGIFEGMRIYAGRVFRLDDHLTRLTDSAKMLMIDLPFDRETLADAVRSAVGRWGEKTGYIRLLVTRGVGPLGLDPNRCEKPTVAVIVDQIQLYPAEKYVSGIPIVTASTRRTPRSSGEARVKSLNYLNNIMAKIEAQQAGCLEALLLNNEGLVAECTADNIFVIRNGKLSTPGAIHGALEGITRKVVLEVAAALSLPASEAALALYDVYTADEVFMTGSGAEIMPIISVDGRSIGNGKPGPITARLQHGFREVTEKN